MLPISEIENRIKYVFSDKQLLESAFIHSSVAHERNINSNERMEFFGDAILEFVVSEYLFTNYPDKDEGDYSKFRAYLVSAKTLSEVVK
ncbi:MAG: ribonuclease III domain-containing protein, partial [Clostridia bacterium]